MKFSLRWLEDHLALTVPVETLLERLTSGGTEVEGVERRGLDDPKVVVAEVLSYVPHPNADRLRLCRVTTGQEERQIVCGAKNFEAGDRVPLALPGAKLPGGLVIKESKLRGELSQGMMCSAKELALAEEAEGLLILPKETPFGPLSAALPADLFIELEITPNRPDLLSYRGLARELAALGCGTLKPLSTPQVAWPAEAPDWKVELAGAACPYYTLALLDNVKVGPSPAWLRDKIAATGHRPINNVVDITNFILWETGQPLHAFDAAKLAGKKIQARFARAGETLAALDEKTYALKETDLVIADAARPQALAGVIGGRESGVGEGTTVLALESAWFEPGMVRQGGRRLGILTDSSYRFERRVDPQAVVAARDRAIALLQELAGAKLMAGPLVVGEPPPSRGPVRLRTERVEAVIGASVPPPEIAAKLESLQLARTAEGHWQPPSFRHDLEAEIDLIEEIARLRGLAELPVRSRFGWVPESEADRIYDKTQRLRRALAARGWQECLTEALAEKAILGGEEGVIEIANPINAQFTHLRPNLRDGLLAVAARNVARGNLSLRLFEIGRVYRRHEGTVIEETRLGLLQLGPVSALEWSARERGSDFYDLTGTTDFLEETVGLGPATRLQRGAVPAEIAKRHDLKAKAFYAEHHLDGWLRHREGPAVFEGLPQFPAVRRDLAVVVDGAVPQEKVRQAIQAGAAAALERIDLFDVFQDVKGEKIAAGKKSLAYALTYRLQDRTLTDKEVNGWQQELRDTLRAALACEFREA